MKYAKYISHRYTLLVLTIASTFVSSAGAETPEGRPADAQGRWAEILVTDSANGRGVPLAELETVNGLRFVTDNAGRVAFYEPGLMDQELFFAVRSHGYEVAKDGFGIAGVRITPRAGHVAEIKLTRRNIAERLCRLTGEGRYRDSELLGHKSPISPAAPGKVAGQDSVQALVYRNKVYWFWGDTLQMAYPLGLLRVAGATTPIPDPADKAFDATVGINFDYFVDPKSGFARAMMPLPERPEGVVWITAVFTVPDDKGVERLVGHYTRRKGLYEEIEQGIAVFNDEKAVFEPAKELPLSEVWRRPSGHPILMDEGGQKWVLFGSPTPNVRVPATFEAVLDPEKYEAFTCVRNNPTEAKSKPDLNVNGQPNWRWQRTHPPVGAKVEYDWIRSGDLKPANARFCPVDAAAANEQVLLHSGSVRWNRHRERWVMLAGQIQGKASMLGEVWYAEAKSPTGPFTRAARVVTHDRQSFYNVCHHSFLDRDGGRVICFEGTYTNDFSGNLEKTSRYNYNQVLYRLDLDAADLRPALVD